MGEKTLCLRTFVEAIQKHMGKKSKIKNFAGISEIKNATKDIVFYQLILEAVLYAPNEKEEANLPSVTPYMVSRLKNGVDDVHEKIVEVAQRKETLALVTNRFIINLVPNIPDISRTTVLDAVHELVQDAKNVKKNKKRELKNSRKEKSPAAYLAEVLLIAICNGENKIKESTIEVIKEVEEKKKELEASTESTCADAMDKRESSVKNVEISSIVEKPTSAVITTSRPLHPTDYFRGREAQLATIKSQLTGSAKLLLLNGMGGIGKTEICRKLFHEGINNKLSEVQKIGWITYGVNLEQAFFGKFSEIKSPAETPHEYMLQAEQYINALGGDLLLFVDNANKMTDEEAAQLQRLECKILITSRYRTTERIKPLEIGRLGLIDCRILYRQHFGLQPLNANSDSIYGIDHTEDPSPDEDLDAIIEIADRHTLAIELLAKTQRAAMQSMKKFRKTLTEQGFTLAGISETITYTPHPEIGGWDKSEQIFIDQFSKVLDISGIPDEKLLILQLFSLLAPEVVPADNAKEWVSVRNLSDFNTLAQLGWLSAAAPKDSEPGFTMHPLISAVVRHSKPPTAEDAKPLIEGLRQELHCDNTELAINKLPNLNHALSLLSVISDTTEEFTDLVSNTAIIHLHMAEFDKCLENLERARDICESTSNINDFMTSSVYHNIGECRFLMGDLDGAREWFTKSIALNEEALEKEKDAPREFLATSYDNLGCLYEVCGEYEEALELFEKALDIRAEELGNKHPSVAWSFNNIATAMQEIWDDYPKILEMYESALAIEEEVLEPNHPDTSSTCNNIASLYERMGEYKTALEWYFRSFKMTAATFGNKHPSALLTLDNIANLYVDMGLYDKAGAIFKRVLRVRKEILGDKHHTIATTLHNIARLHYAKNEYDEALNHCCDALGIYQEIYASEHPDTIAVHMTMADIYKGQGQPDKALNLYQEMITVGVKIYGERHSNVAVFYNNLGGAYADVGQHDKAIPLYNDALSIQEEVFGRKHTHTITTINNIAASYSALGDYKEALIMYWGAYIGNEEVWDGEHPDLAVVAENLASTYYKQGLGEETEGMLFRAYQIRSRFFDEEHPIVTDTLDRLLKFHELFPCDSCNVSFGDCLKTLEKSITTDWIEEKRQEACV